MCYRAQESTRLFTICFLQSLNTSRPYRAPAHICFSDKKRSMRGLSREVMTLAGVLKRSKDSKGWGRDSGTTEIRDG